MDRKRSELDALEVELSDPAVWGDPGRTKVLKQRRSRLTESIAMAASLGRLLDDARTLHELAREGEDVLPDLVTAVSALEERVEETELADASDAASTTAPPRSSRSTRAPAARSRKTGRRCCTACTSAGRSAAGSRCRRSTGRREKRRGSKSATIGVSRARTCTAT